MMMMMMKSPEWSLLAVLLTVIGLMSTTAAGTRHQTLHQHKGRLNIQHFAKCAAK